MTRVSTLDGSKGKKLKIPSDQEFFAKVKKGTYLKGIDEYAKKDMVCDHIRSMWYGSRELCFGTESPLFNEDRKWAKKKGEAFKNILITPVSAKNRFYNLLINCKKWTAMYDPENKIFLDKEFKEPMDCLGFAFYIVYNVPHHFHFDRDYFIPKVHYEITTRELKESSPPMIPTGIIICYWSKGTPVHFGIKWTRKWILSKLGSTGSLCFNTHEELVKKYGADNQTVCGLMDGEDWKKYEKSKEYEEYKQKRGGIIKHPIICECV